MKKSWSFGEKTRENNNKCIKIGLRGIFNNKKNVL